MERRAHADADTRVAKARERHRTALARADELIAEYRDVATRYADEADALKRRVLLERLLEVVAALGLDGGAIPLDPERFPAYPLTTEVDR